MNKFKYLIVGYASINGQKLNAKICFDDSDFDYWIGSFGIEGDEYTQIKSTVDKHGWAEFIPHKTGFSNSFVKIFTFNHIINNSQSYKY